MKKNLLKTLFLTGVIKIYLLFAIISFLPFSSHSQSYDNPESVVYDQVNDRYLISNTNSGTIVQGDTLGNLSDFAENLFSPKGLVIVDTVVYVADGNIVTGFGLSSQDTVFNVSITGSSYLNDIAADDQGNLYISTDVNQKIYKVKLSDKSFSVLVDSGLIGPNGLLFDKSNNRLLVCSFSFTNDAAIQAISLPSGTVSLVKATTLATLDGITEDNEGNIYISSWGDSTVYKYNSDFTVGPEVVSSGHNGPADIFYDKVNYVLAIPNMMGNSVDFIHFIKPPNVYEVAPAILSFDAFPNPANNEVKISFSVENSSQVRIQLIDITGSINFTLLNEVKGRGLHSHTYDIEDLQIPNGLYFVRINVGDKVSVLKLVVN